MKAPHWRDAQLHRQLPRRGQARAGPQFVVQDAFLQYPVQAAVVGLAAGAGAVEAALQVIDQHAGAMGGARAGHGEVGVGGPIRTRAVGGDTATPPGQRNWLHQKNLIGSYCKEPLARH
jgi:hypothetical protein